MLKFRNVEEGTKSSINNLEYLHSHSPFSNSPNFSSCYSKKRLLIFAVSILFFFWYFAADQYYQIQLRHTVGEIDFEYSVLSEDSPRILVAYNFLTPEECSHIIDMAIPYLERSKVSSENLNGKIDQVRTSSGTWISRFSSDPAIKKFVTRASNWIGKSPYHSESVQVLQYDLTQEYKPHPDYFDPKRLPHYLKNGGQRIASVMVYLNNVTEGGETVFPRRAYNRVSIKPEQGKAVAWYNVKPNGDLDEESIHGSQPVVAGKKYVAILWIHERERS